MRTRTKWGGWHNVVEPPPTIDFLRSLADYESRTEPTIRVPVIIHIRNMNQLLGYGVYVTGFVNHKFPLFRRILILAETKDGKKVEVRYAISARSIKAQIRFEA